MQWVAMVTIILKNLCDKRIVDGNDISRWKLCCVLDVAGNMDGRASWREGTWHANDQGFSLWQFFCYGELIPWASLLYLNIGNRITDIDEKPRIGMEQSAAMRESLRAEGEGLSEGLHRVINQYAINWVKDEIRGVAVLFTV